MPKEIQQNRHIPIQTTPAVYQVAFVNVSVEIIRVLQLFVQYCEAY